MVVRTVGGKEMIEQCVLVLALHGAGQSPDYMQDRWATVAVEQGWDLVTPTTPDRVWDIEPGSRDLRDLRRIARQSPCTTKFVVGHSMGAHAASVLSCTTRLFDAAVPVAGVTVTRPCRTTTKVLAIHGARDPFTELGGDSLPLVPRWAQVDRREAVARWSAGSRCAATPAVTNNEKRRTTTYRYGCRHTLVVNWDGFHEWGSRTTALATRFFQRVAAD